MRTTVTLDPDVERLLKTTAHKRGKSFKVVLNEAIRQSLSPRKKTSAKPLLLPAHSSGLRPGFTWDNLSDQAEELEDREIAARLRLPMKPIKSPKAQVHAHS
jgi:hypothetical protein